MKRTLSFIIILSFILFNTTHLKSQTFAPLDKSPHDIVYYKVDKKSSPLIKVLYGRPALKGRSIENELAPLGKVWRTGANEATEIKFYKDVIFGDKKIKAGTYSLFTIPNNNEWTIILNADLDVFGAYNYNEKQDSARIIIPVKNDSTSVENFSIAFNQENDLVKMILAWGTMRIEIPINVN